MAAAEQERVDKLSKYGVAVAKAEDVIRGNLKLGEAGYKEWRENAEAEMGLYGESFDEALAKAGDASKKLGDNGKLLAKYTTDMSGDAKKQMMHGIVLFLTLKLGKSKRMLMKL